MSQNNNTDESFFKALDEELSSFMADRASLGKIGATTMIKGSGTAGDPYLGEASQYTMIADMTQIAEKLDVPVHFVYEGKGYVATRKGIMESDEFDALDELDEAKVTPGQTKEEHYGSWILRFELRPVAGSKEYRGRAWHSKSDKTPPVVVTGSSADDVKAKLVATIDSTKSRKTIDPKSYVTIDFNVLTTKDIVGHKDAIFCDVEDINGMPTLLISAEQPGGFQVAADRTALAQQGEHRTGQHAFRLRGDKAAAAGLTHARYALGEPFDYSEGVTAFPLKFSSEVHPGEIIRLSEPGVTVAYPRNIAEVNENGEFEGIFSKKEDDITEGIFNSVGLTPQQRDLIRKFFGNYQGTNVDVKYSKDGDYVLTTALGHHNNTIFRFWNEDGKLMANIEYYRSRNDAGNIKQAPLTTIMDVEIRGPWQLEELMTKYGGLKEDAIVESESNLNYYEGTGNELYAEIKEIMHDLVYDFASFAVPAHTRPSAPDSTKFRAEISGVIEYATNVRIDGGKYGIPKSYKMFLKIGKAVKPEIRDNIRSEFERDIYALTAQSSVNPITTSDGYTFSFSNVEGGTAWGGIGVIITPPKASIAESNEGKARIRSYKDRNGVTKYEVLNADGVRVKGDLSKEMADDYMRAHRSELQESAGSFRVNMAQMDRWKVDQDNVRYYDHIMKNKGKVQTLDTRPYIEYLNQFGIFYTGPKLTESEELSGYKMLGDLSKVNTDDLLAQLKIRTQLAATGKYNGPTLNRIQAGIGRIESALSDRGIKISESELTEDDFSIADMDPDYEEEEESNEFYVAIYNEDDNTTFIGKLVNEGRRWKELNVAGTPPYNWPCHGYMGYLTPSDVMSWIYKDYSRGYEVKGPFATRQAATQWAEHNFGPLGESAQEIEKGKLDIRLGQQGAKNKDQVRQEYSNMIDCTEELEAIHLESAQEFVLQNKGLYESHEKISTSDMLEFLAQQRTQHEVVGESYIYCSIHVHPVANMILDAHFMNPHKLCDKKNNQYMFDINGKYRTYPENAELAGDTIKYTLLFDTYEHYESFVILLSLKYGENKIIQKVLDMRQDTEANHSINTQVEGLESGPLGESTEGERKWEVSYDFYGSNTEVPLYSKSVIVRASSGDEAVALVKRLIGGRNHKAVPTELVAEAGKKGMSAHAKEMRKKNDEYYSQQVLNREKEHGETYNYGNAKVSRPPEKKVEESWSKNPSGTWTNNHTGRSYSQKGGGPDNGGNSSYMTPEYMRDFYTKELERIAAGPYKRTRAVERIKRKLAALEGQNSSIIESANDKQIAAKEKKIASLEKKYDGLGNRISLAKEKRRTKGDRLLSTAEQKAMTLQSQVYSEILKLKQEIKSLQQVDESIKFSKGAYPDVDHMPGAVHKNWDDSTKKQVIPFKNRSAWETTAQKANSELYDDNAEITSMGALREYEIDGKVFARWVETSSSGWVQITPINESVVTEKSVSVKQARLMSAAAHDPKFAKKVGIKQSVAKEFNDADKGSALLKKASKKENK